MCIADTRIMPSSMPAAARHFSTSSVMSMISWRRFVLKVRYEVWNFMRWGSGGGVERAPWTPRIFYETTFPAMP